MFKEFKMLLFESERCSEGFESKPLFEQVRVLIYNILG